MATSTATVNVSSNCMLPNGHKMIAGTITFSAGEHASGGVNVNFSTHFLSSSTPVVIYGGDDGYVAQSDRGTASAGKVILYQSDDAVDPLDDIGTATITNVVLTFIAIGQTASST